MAYTKEDMKKMLSEFLSEGCPNHPKDERGSWLVWLDKFLKKMQQNKKK